MVIHEGRQWPPKILLQRVWGPARRRTPQQKQRDHQDDRSMAHNCSEARRSRKHSPHEPIITLRRSFEEADTLDEELWAGYNFKAMSEPHFIIMPLADRYAAISNRHGQFTSLSLAGFGGRIRTEVHQRFAIDESDIEFSLSDDLRSKFAACEVCSGATRVEVDAIAGQYLRDEFAPIDWSKKATETCSACSGLGVEIPDFWRTPTVA